MDNPKPIVGRRIDKSTIINLERGKIPPQAVDLEEVVLGAMMIDKKGVDEVIDILHPDVFYKEAHRQRDSYLPELPSIVTAEVILAWLLPLG